MAIHSSIFAWRIPMDRGAQQATVHGLTKSWTQLSRAQCEFYDFGIKYTYEFGSLNWRQCESTLEEDQNSYNIILYILMMINDDESRSVVSDSLQPHGLQSPWNSPGQNTGVGSLSLLQGIFPTQGLNPDLPNCRWILYQLSYQGSPSPVQ